MLPTGILQTRDDGPGAATSSTPSHCWEGPLGYSPERKACAGVLEGMRIMLERDCKAPRRLHAFKRIICVPNMGRHLAALGS